MYVRLLLIIAFLLFKSPGNAQSSAQSNPGNGYDTLSLADLMNIKITVASITELTPRQSPGIVNYITQDEIRERGARDLMEVLQHLPGFDFGVDVEGVVGLGVRGNWAHEGKVVLLIDGQEMNEGLYSTLQFGNHYPVENIDRIEIIRGPGSAMYGGYAAYAVINVVTKTPKNHFEVQSSTFYGSTSKDYSLRGANLFLGSKKEKNAISLQACAAQGMRSNQTYKDVFGNSYSMENNSGIDNVYLNFGSNIGKLGFRAIADFYNISSSDEYQEIVSKPVLLGFKSYLGEINYEFKLNDKWRFLPKLNYKYQVPWSSDGSSTTDEEQSQFKISSERYTASLTSIYDPSDRINISSGIQYYFDKSNNKVIDNVFLTTGTSSLSYNNFSGFFQGLFRSNIVNIIAGLRYNDNDRYNSTLVPRIGLTREFQKLNLKALYNRSFRSPGTQNIDLSSGIKPEVTNVYELEVGYRLNDFSYLTVNSYLIDTRDPIVYYFDTTTNFDAYTNYYQTGTYGLELAYRYKKPWGGIDFNASWYKSNDKNNLTIYNIPGEENQHLGLSPFKADLGIRYTISKSITLSSSFTLYSKKYGIVSLDEQSDLQVYKQLPASGLLTFLFDYHFNKINGLSIQICGHNLLNDKQWFVQPYNSEHAPLPGMGRQLQLKITYQNF
jgi:outer membrane cobalamin receptor